VYKRQGLVGIALIFLSEFFPSGSKSAETSSTPTVLSASEYSQQLGNQLQELIGQIRGVGRIMVMVTIQSGVENVYEQTERTTNGMTNNTTSDSTQTQQNTDQEKSTVIIDSGNGGQQAIVKTEKQPIVKGVAIVCDGGDNPVVVNEIIGTLTSILDISADRISVSKMKE
jgi:stage III sporulation protein AG